MSVNRKLLFLVWAALDVGYVEHVIAGTAPIIQDATVTHERELIYKLSMAPLPERQDVRWRLAEYYVTLGKAPDALGVLAVIVRNEPKLDSSPRMLFLRGRAHFLMGHYEDARADLEQIVLDGEPQVWLRRVVLREEMGKNGEAIVAWKRGVSALPKLSVQEQAGVRFAVARAAIADQNLALVDAVLTGLPKSQHYAEADLLRARASLLAGNADHANYYLKMASNDGDRRIGAEAELILINQALHLKTLSPSQAIAQLDKLRFAWRGDRFELAVLRKLADLYIQTGQWRAALTSLRQASTYIQEGRRDPVLSHDMQSIFSSLFANGKAETLPPLEALSLFSDFRDLAPLGEEGDRMIRNLSDRLVTVGLPDRAARLLGYQVQHRLSGTAQSVVAVRAALLDILSNQPKSAVAILRATKQNELPDDIRRLRYLVEARALIQMAETESALNLIQDDRSLVADRLRADGYWRAKNWRALHKKIAQIYTENSQNLTNSDHRMILRWAFALSMDGTAAEREQLKKRYSEAMEKTSYHKAFGLLTSGTEISTKQISSLAVTLADIDRLEDISLLYPVQPRSAVVFQPRTVGKQQVKYATN